MQLLNILLRTPWSELISAAEANASTPGYLWCCLILSTIVEVESDFSTECCM